MTIAVGRPVSVPIRDSLLFGGCLAPEGAQNLLDACRRCLEQGINTLLDGITHFVNLLLQGVR